MNRSNGAMRYGAVAQTFHWVTAILFVITVVIALILPEDPETAIEYAEYGVHKTLGVTIFALTVVRLIWRQISPPPPLPADVAAWERWSARAVQYLLYFALLAQPAIGVLMVWTDGHAVTVFGFIALPTPFGENEALNAIFDPLHAIVGWAFICLAGLHALAALRHHFVLKNDVLRRMLPGSAG